MGLKKLTYQVIILFLIVLPLYASAQSKPDSIKALIAKENNISEKARLYLELSNAYADEDPEKAEESAQMALQFAGAGEDDKIAGLAHLRLGEIAFMQDSLEKAEDEYARAIPLLKKTAQNKKLIETYLSLGNRFVEKGNYPDAMSIYLEGLKLSDQNNDSSYLSRLYNNLGVVYINLDEYENALEYYTKALHLFEQHKDTINVAGTTTNIGSIYMKLGKTGVAEQYYRKGFSLFKDINHTFGEAHALFKLSEVQQQQKKFDDALQTLEQSLEILKADTSVSVMSKSMFLSEIYVNMGVIYLDKDQDDKALHYLKKGLELARKNGQIEIISQATMSLSRLYKKRNDFKNALSYYELYKQYSDSVFNEDNIRKLTRTEMQYKFDRKMKEAEYQSALQAQRQKVKVWITIAVALLLLLSLIIVVLLLKLEKNRKKKMQSDMVLLEDKLEHANKELATYVLYLMKKNEFILSIIEKLKRARLDAKTENKKVLSELINELKSNTGMISWDEFEVRFQEVHTDFYRKLHERYPNLTNNEIRLCAFFKLNMTTKEIAAITYQSLNSIKVARYRLRKKLNLSKDESLTSFLSRF